MKLAFNSLLLLQFYNDDKLLLTLQVDFQFFIVITQLLLTFMVMQVTLLFQFFIVITHTMMLPVSGS